MESPFLPLLDVISFTVRDDDDHSDDSNDAVAIEVRRRRGQPGLPDPTPTNTNKPKAHPTRSRRLMHHLLDTQRDAMYIVALDTFEPSPPSPSSSSSSSNNASTNRVALPNVGVLRQMMRVVESQFEETRNRTPLWHIVMNNG